MTPISDRHEWLEADGLGGFASGTTSGIRTRRYHALLLSAQTPPTGRQVLVSGIDAWVTTPRGTCALSSQRYVPGVESPDGVSRLTSFTAEPWPTWRYALAEGGVLEHAVFVPRGHPLTVLRWRLVAGAPGARLTVRPFFACRDYHALQGENGAFRFDPDRSGGLLRWRPYEGTMAIMAAANARYVHQPDWYRRFLYTEEQNRGLDAVEDLPTPGTFEWDLSSGDAVLVLAADSPATRTLLERDDAVSLAERLARDERQRRDAFEDPLARGADPYIVRRGQGATIVAGYPWFTDWGRDTFIAMRGLCLATGRFDVAREIVLEWSAAVSAGMLPNRFVDRGEEPEYNAVDGSLWFIVAAHEWLEADPAVTPAERARVVAAIEAILDGYSRGTRYGIRAGADGLLEAGVEGAQLTWMDAKIGDRVITPRIGKPVEVQALWINALWIAARYSERWSRAFARAAASFEPRFWNAEAGALYDVVDVDHQPGRLDASFRPNQILAVGGLPLTLVQRSRATRIVTEIERRLWTPLGLRSLAPGEPAYVGRYAGGVDARDGAYHQGTVWPWLMGPFVEAWVRTHGGTAAARKEARARFFTPLLTHLQSAGVGHLPEVADGDAPHAPGGCPFQAWSIGEALRLDRIVLGSRRARRDTRGGERHRTLAVEAR